MEALILGAQSSDTKTKLAAVEDTHAYLQQSPAMADAANDSKFRLMSSCVSLMKDANPKVAQLSLDCVEIFITHSFSILQPLMNITFDVLIAKFGDIKLPTRTRSTDVMVSLINAVGLATGLEKLLPHLGHRVWRVREQVLQVLRRLVHIYGSDVIIVPDLPKQLSALLPDPQSSVRQLAADVLCDLYNTFGDSMLTDLEAAGIRPSQLNLIQQSITAKQGTREGVQADMATLEAGPPPSGPTPRGGLSATSRPRASSRGPSGQPVLQRAISDPQVDHPSKSASGQSARAARGGASALGSTAPVRSSISRDVGPEDVTPKEFNPHAPSPVSKKYSPDYFLSILGDGPSLPRSSSVVLYTERDLQGQCSTILEGLQKPSDHWEDRLSALARLQLLACLDAADFDSFSSLLKGMHEQVSIQVTDLRSTVSKEACRTVAILANRMANAFGPFAELWLPTLLKIITVKISVISSAADRAAKTVVYSVVSGSARVVPTLLETCSAKNPALRKVGFELSCIAFARWKSDCFEKHASAINKILVAGISDADPGARKGARLLFWVIHARGGMWKSAMTTLLRDLDVNAQRHVRSEADSSKDDLSDLFRKPDTCFPLENYYTCGSSNQDVVPAASSATSGKASTMSLPRQQSADRAIEKVSSGHSSGNNTTCGRGSRPEEAFDKALEVSAAVNGAPGMGLPARVTPSATKPASSISSSPSYAPATLVDPPAESFAPPTMSLAAARELRENRTGSRRLSVVPSPSLLSSDEPTSTSSASVMGSSRRMSVGVTSSRQTQSATGQRESVSALTNGPKRIARPSSTPKPVASVSAQLEPTLNISAPSKSMDEPEPPTGVPHRAGSNDTYSDSGRGEDTATDDGSIDLSVPGDETLTAFSGKYSTLFELRHMTADSQWDVRLKALTEIKYRTTSAFPPYYYQDGVFLGAAAHKNKRQFNAAVNGCIVTSDHALPVDYVEGVVDLTVAKIGDAHNHVAMAALQCIYLLVFPIEVKEPTTSSGSERFSLSPILSPASALSKLGYMMPALFSRLADRRSKIRDKANEILNNIKTSYDPNLLIAALSPRLCEVSERVRTAVVQFLLTIAALCEAYFRNPSNAHQFLSRMAHLLGSGGAMKPSNAFVLTGKRLLELVYKTTPQIMLSQISSLPLQEQIVIKKTLSSAVKDIDAAVAAASKVEWNRTTSADAGTARIISHSSRQSQEAPTSFPVANLDISVGSHSIRSDADHRESPKVASPDRVLYSSIESNHCVEEEEEEERGDSDNALFDSEHSMYAPLPDDTDFALEVDIHSPIKSPSKPSPSTRCQESKCSPKISPGRNEMGDWVQIFSPEVVETQFVTAGVKSPMNDSPKNHIRDDRKSPKASLTVGRAGIISPTLNENRDIVWLLRSLSSTDFSMGGDYRAEAMTELKVLIKQGTDAFWTRNFAQIISVLLDSFSPVTTHERAISLHAASGVEEYTLVGEGRQTAITGLSPPPSNGIPIDSRYTRIDSRDEYRDLGSSKAHVADGGLVSSSVQRENLSASDFNNTRPNRAESKSPTNDFSANSAGDAEQVFRMEYLHRVSRALLLIVRHRSQNILNFLELMTCRLCEASAFLPLALSMQCEQILGMACPLGAQGMAKALAPYCAYGHGSVSVGDQENGLPPPPDPSFAASPTSAVRRLALRVLALCVPHMTSRQLVSILPLLMDHILPSFRSPLVDIRQAVVGAIVQMYVLVGDVLHPYVKELPPQQKKLLTIYIDRQLKSNGGGGKGSSSRSSDHNFNGTTRASAST